MQQKRRVPAVGRGSGWGATMASCDHGFLAASLKAAFCSFVSQWTLKKVKKWNLNEMELVWRKEVKVRKDQLKKCPAGDHWARWALLLSHFC